MTEILMIIWQWGIGAFATFIAVSMAVLCLSAILFTIKETFLRMFKGVSMIYTQKEIKKWNK